MDEPRPPKAPVKFDDFARLDLRVAKVTACREHPNADKLLILTIDLGTEQRQVCAGLRGHYQPEQLVGKLVVVVANLEPRSMRGEASQALVLAASQGPHKEALAVITLDADIAPGSVVS